MVAARVVFDKRDGQGPLEEGEQLGPSSLFQVFFHIVARPIASLVRSIESGRTIFATVFVRERLT